MSNLLINEHPLMVLPSLATKIGLNEAIIIQQVHYWLNISTKVHEGRKWTYNTYQEWQKQFPFWSERTIRRAIKNLEENGYLLVGNFNKLSFDKTKWYTIDYVKLNENNSNNNAYSGIVQQYGQSDQTMRTDCPDEMRTDCPDGVDNVTRTIPETSSETTTKITTNNNIVQQAELCIPFEEIINYLNQQAGTKYKHSTKSTQGYIKARWNEGFNSIEEYKTVIDNKVAD